MTLETAVPVQEKNRTSAQAPCDTRHDWPRGHPRVDRFELDDRLIIKMELPDVKRDDIDLRLEGRDLVIYDRARHDEHELLRRISMPSCVTAGDVQARFDESVLRVEVRRPKINVR